MNSKYNTSLPSPPPHHTPTTLKHGDTGTYKNNVLVTKSLTFWTQKLNTFWVHRPKGSRQTSSGRLSYLMALSMHYNKVVTEQQRRNSSRNVFISVKFCSELARTTVGATCIAKGVQGSWRVFGSSLRISVS